MRRIALVQLIVVVMAAGVACSDGGERFPAPSTVDMGEGGHAVKHPTSACTDGDTRSCHVVLGVQGTVTACFDGFQECADGGWGDCIDPTVADQNDEK